MANKEHAKKFSQGVRQWNKWRDENPEVQPDLDGLNLRGAYLRKANLTGALLRRANLRRARLSKSRLSGADLSEANLRAAYFRGADLSGATLKNANLKYTMMVGVNLEGADISGCRVYGVAAWDLQGVPECQTDLVITRRSGDSIIRVDQLELAHFIHLLLDHKNLRGVIDSVTQRGVLVLGRFEGGGLEILREIASILRAHEYLPIIFDFDRPQDRNYTETVKTLVGLSRFVIVDLSGPSVPQELYATVPHFKIPFVPIIDSTLREYALTADLLDYPWMLKPIVRFQSVTDLRRQFESQILVLAEEKIESRRTKSEIQP